MSMVDKAAPKEIDRATVLDELTHRWKESAGFSGGDFPRIDWVLDQLADLDVLGYRALADDPSTNPVGTVRRQDLKDGGYTVWQVWANQYGDRTWRVSWSTNPVARSFVRSDADVVGFPVIGAAPGTPAAEAAQRQIVEQEAVTEPRVFQADGPEPPTDVDNLEVLHLVGAQNHKRYLRRGGIGWHFTDELNTDVSNVIGFNWPASVAGTFREVVPS